MTPSWLRRPCAPCAKYFREAHLIGIFEPYIAGVVEGTHWLDDQLFLEASGPWANRWHAVAARLRQEHIDLAVLFPNSFRSAWVAWLGRCRRRVGYCRYGRSLLLTQRHQPVRDGRGRLLPSPVIDAYNQLVMSVGCADPGYRMELGTTPRDEAAADRVWQQAEFRQTREVVCLNPGAAFGSAKYWPAESFASWRDCWLSDAAAACWFCVAPMNASWRGKLSSWLIVLRYIRWPMCRSR